MVRRGWDFADCVIFSFAFDGFVYPLSFRTNYESRHSSPAVKSYAGF